MQYVGWIAISLYLLVALLAANAAFAASRCSMNRSVSIQWLVIGLVFIVLALARFGNAEDILRNALRDDFRLQGWYEHRQEMQRPLIAGLVFVMGLVGLRIAYSLPSAAKGRRALLLWIAKVASAGFIPLFALRIVSLHATDALLYGGGPLRLNWILDLGICLVVAGAAFAFAWLCRLQQSGASHR